MQKIVPYLWYDKEAVEAATMYTGLFENSAINQINHLSDTPSGDVDMVDFQLAGLQISAISGGPFFKFNSALSFMVACENQKEVDRLYNELVKDGEILMPLGEYPFSKYYGWFQDRYGLNWQLIMVENMEEQPRIRPVLLFSDKMCGKAQEALNYYNEVFKESEKGNISYYEKDKGSDPRANINYGELKFEDIQFVMMDHGVGGSDSFNEAVSFMISCDTQEEIDYYWEKLSFVPEAEQCGWVKDQFGVSWQVVPSIMGKIFEESTEEQAAKVTQAFLKMKKFDIKALEEAAK